jgi:hypothetical protein
MGRKGGIICHIWLRGRGVGVAGDRGGGVRIAPCRASADVCENSEKFFVETGKGYGRKL